MPDLFRQAPLASSISWFLFVSLNFALLCLCCCCRLIFSFLFFRYYPSAVVKEPAPRTLHSSSRVAPGGASKKAPPISARARSLRFSALELSNKKSSLSLYRFLFHWLAPPVPCALV
jgi:hypothetical protein